jgi:outer membrane biosynthesis protein TonB
MSKKDVYLSICKKLAFGGLCLFGGAAIAADPSLPTTNATGNKPNVSKFRDKIQEQRKEIKELHKEIKQERKEIHKEKKERREKRKEHRKEERKEHRREVRREHRQEAQNKQPNPTASTPHPKASPKR